MKTKFTILEIYGSSLTCYESCNLKLKSLEFSGNNLNYHFFKKTIVSITFILFMLSVSFIGQAQQIVQVDNAIAELIKSGDPVLQQQAIELSEFVDDANPDLMAKPTLVINGEGFKIIDGDVPVVLKLQMSDIEKIYSQHPDFENIKMIRIMVEDIPDLNQVVNLENLNHFPNLKYVYFLSLFEVCPNNPGDEECHSSTFVNMVSGIGESIDAQVFFKVSSVW